MGWRAAIKMAPPLGRTDGWQKGALTVSRPHPDGPRRVQGAPWGAERVEDVLEAYAGVDLEGGGDQGRQGAHAKQVLPEHLLASYVL